MISLIGTGIEVVKGPRKLIDNHDDNTEVYHAITLTLMDELSKTKPVSMSVKRPDGFVTVITTLEGMITEAKRWDWSHSFFANGISEIHLTYFTFTEIFTPFIYREDHVNGVVTI